MGILENDPVIEFEEDGNPGNVLYPPNTLIPSHTEVDCVPVKAEVHPYSYSLSPENDLLVKASFIMIGLERDSTRGSTQVRVTSLRGA